MAVSYRARTVYLNSTVTNMFSVCHDQNRPRSAILSLLITRLGCNSDIPRPPLTVQSMMTSSNGNIFRVTSPLWRESTGLRWIPLTKISDAELWWFLWSTPEQTVEQTIDTLVIWNAIALIMTWWNWWVPMRPARKTIGLDHGNRDKILITSTNKQTNKCIFF